MRCLFALALTLLTACNPQEASSEPSEPSAASPAAPQDTSAPEPGDEARCRALDSKDLDERVDAAKHLSNRHAPMTVGGTEQTMEAAAEWCIRTFDIRPGWLPADR